MLGNALGALHGAGKVVSKYAGFRHLVLMVLATILPAFVGERALGPLVGRRGCGVGACGRHVQLCMRGGAEMGDGGGG